MTFCVCIFVRARLYANDFPYCSGNFGPFRGWRCGRRMRHYPAAEDRSVPDYRGDCGVARVLWRVKEVIFITMYCYFTKIYIYSSKKGVHHGNYNEYN